MLTRMFACLTVLTYLMVGTVAVRIFFPSTTELTLSTRYLSLMSNTEIKSEEVERLNLPEVLLSAVEVSGDSSLPFDEEIQLEQVTFDYELPTNLLALFRDVEVQDSISTKLASKVAPEEVAAPEPEFFEYPKEEVAAKTETTPAQVVEEVKVQAEPVPATKVVLQDQPAEVVPVSQLVSFDYSKAQQEIANKTVPTVSHVTPQAPTPTKPQEMTTQKEEKKFSDKSLKTAKHPMELTIQMTGTDLKKTQKLTNFEVRFQDDQSETREDYGHGEVVLNDQLSEARMTRSIALLKQGFVPVSTDLILEEGVALVTVPSIEQSRFNDLMTPFQAGPMGAVLVELDDETEMAELDVGAGKTMQLDGDLLKTKSGDFRYQLFLGVKAGNALLTYKGFNGQKVSKIIHVHENELTYDSNFFEASGQDTFKLVEEDLMAKEASPLIIASHQVKQFATNNESQKIDDHTYKVNFGVNHLAGRKYLELTHQSEPIFVGVRDNAKISVPSENFMRYMLSRFEGAKLGQRCMVQVNLSKKAESMQIGSESVASSLVTYTQVLDKDGKFYDSIGEKTRKIIIVGENQGSGDISQDAKINIKIEYQDGTNQYLSSYCSPNSYLVEQL